MTDDELWSAVVGQTAAVALLEAASRAPVHAYLFVGPEGAGRRQAAAAFAGAILSSGTSGGDADRHRRLAVAERHPDLVWIEPKGRAMLVAEADTVTVEGFRSPIEADRKVIVIDRFDTAEPEAAAGLLKTIEEPPATAVFVLLADEVPEWQVTIASRCIRVDLPPLPEATVVDALVADGVDPDRAAVAAAAAAGDIGRARLLVDDPAVAGRRQAWWSVPDRLDGTGAAVAVLVAELQGLIDDAQGPLAQRQQAELDDLAERETALGTRGSGRQQLVDRHKREIRRLRDDDLRFGLATLARRYLDAAADGAGPPVRLLDAPARITAATAELVRNPNETLLLQGLFLDLPALAR